MKKLISLVLVFLLIFGSFADVFAAADTKASVIRLSKKEGTVTVKDASGSKVNVNDGGKILSGYSVATGKDGTAYLNLDDTKIVKLDLNTTVEIKKNKKKIEVYVASGNIFVSVAEKLNSDEELNIKTTNIAVGVRGTMLEIGYLDDGGAMNVSANVRNLTGSASGKNEKALDYCNIIEGSIEARNEITGQVISGSAGEQILAEDRSGQPSQGAAVPMGETKVELVKKTFAPVQLQPSTLVELKDDARIQELPNSQEYKQAIEEAPKRQEEKKEASENKADAIEEKTAKQEENTSTVQVFSSKTLSDGEKNPFYAAVSSDSDGGSSYVRPVTPVVYRISLPEDSSLITYTPVASSNSQLPLGYVEDGEDFNFTVYFDKKISSLYITYQTEESNGEVNTLYSASKSTDGNGNHIYSFTIPGEKVSEGVSVVAPVAGVTDISNISALFADPGITTVTYVTDSARPQFGSGLTASTQLEVPVGKTLAFKYDALAVGRVGSRMVLGTSISGLQAIDTGLEYITFAENVNLIIKGTVFTGVPTENAGSVVIDVDDTENNCGLVLGNNNAFYNHGTLELAKGSVGFNIENSVDASLSVTGNVSIAENCRVNIIADADSAGSMSVAEGAQLVNDGTIAIESNCNTVDESFQRAALTNNGDVINTAKGSVINYGVINNYGSVVNYGTFNSLTEEFGDLPESCLSAVYNMGSIHNAKDPDAETGGCITSLGNFANGFDSPKAEEINADSTIKNDSGASIVIGTDGKDNDKAGLDGFVNFGVITNNGNVTVSNKGSFINGSDDLAAGYFHKGIFSNEGGATVTITAEGSIFNNMGQSETYELLQSEFSNSGTVTVDSASGIENSGSIINYSNGMINNAGTISNCSYSSDYIGMITNYGGIINLNVLQNDGTVDNYGVLTLGEENLESNAILYNNGSVTNTEDGRLVVYYEHAGIISGDDYPVTNDGTITIYYESQGSGPADAEYEDGIRASYASYGGTLVLEKLISE